MAGRYEVIPVSFGGDTRWGIRDRVIGGAAVGRFARRESALRLAIALCWRAAGAPTAPPDALLRVRITELFPRPARTRRAPRPDVDNLAKLVMDALNGLAWAHDRLIVDLHVGKGWTTGPPSTRITAWIARDEDDADYNSGSPGGTR